MNSIAKRQATFLNLTNDRKQALFKVDFPAEQQLVCLRLTSKKVTEDFVPPKRIRTDEESEVKIFGEKEGKWKLLFARKVETRNLEMFVFLKDFNYKCLTFRLENLSLTIVAYFEVGEEGQTAQEAPVPAPTSDFGLGLVQLVREQLTDCTFTDSVVESVSKTEMPSEGQKTGGVAHARKMSLKLTVNRLFSALKFDYSGELSEALLDAKWIDKFKNHLRDLLTINSEIGKPVS